MATYRAPIFTNGERFNICPTSVRLNDAGNTVGELVHVPASAYPMELFVAPPTYPPATASGLSITGLHVLSTELPPALEVLCSIAKAYNPGFSVDPMLNVNSLNPYRSDSTLDAALDEVKVP